MAIETISGTINRMAELATRVAGAIDEQSSSAREIGRNAGQAARGTSAISESLDAIARAASSSRTDVDEVVAASRHLSEQATKLRAEVERFLQGVRSAA